MKSTQNISFAWFMRNFFRRTGKTILIFGLITNILSYTVPLFIMNVYDKIIPNGYDSLLHVFMFIAISLCLIYFILSSYIDFQVKNELTFIMFEAEDAITKKIPEIIINRNDPDHNEFFYLQAKNAINHVCENMRNINLLSLVDLPFSIICISLIFYLGGSLGYISLFVFLLIALVNILSQKTIKAFIDNAFLFRAKASQNQNELCQKQTQIKLYNYGDIFFKRHQKYQKPVNAINFRTTQAKIDNFSTLLAMVATIFLISVGAKQIEQGNLLVGNLVAISIFSGRLFSTARLCKTLYNFRLLKICFDKLYLFSKQKKENISSNPIPEEINSIVCKDFCFSYFKDQPVLKDINLCIGKNMTYINGNGGSGKTTLFYCLAMIRTPVAGSLLINNFDHKNFREKDIRDKIHFSCSEQAFFSGTIAENLFLGKNVNSKVLDEVLEALDLKRRMLKSGLKFDQVIGGQLKLPFSFSIIQLLKITRALISEAQIIIFDDPFVGLDDMTTKRAEQAIFDFCVKYKKGLCIISSKQPSLKSYDQYLVLDEGKLV